jgi:hypothetical protein
MQLGLIFEDIKNVNHLSDISYGKAVTVIDSGEIVAKVRPRGFLLNSNLVSDVLNRADCFVVNMENGDLTIMKSTTAVTY